MARASPITLTMVLKRSLVDDTNERLIKKFISLVCKWADLTFTYNAQSTAMISVMSSVGKPTEVSTITMVTSPACGIPAAPMLAAVAVMLKENI